MHNIIVLASVLLPLIGVMQMEHGAFGNSIGMYGYPNGASAVYAMYAAVLLTVYFTLRACAAMLPVAPARSRPRFDAYAKLLVGLFLPILLVMLFGFGGWAVWLGQVGKGEFRANLGPLGAVAYLLINSVVPLLMTYAAVLYRGAPGDWRERTWLAVLFGLTLLIGSTWGFKATGVTMLLPALVVLFRDAGLGRVLAVCGAIALTIAAFFYLFDSETSEAAGGDLAFLLTRLTTLQGDVSWLLWGQHTEGAPFPPYLQTLLVFVGDTAFATLTGITRNMPDLWADYHFDILLGLLAGLPLSVVDEGHSIVGTPFADGLVLGGMPGVLAMALFAGLLCGVLCAMIERALRRGQTFRCALLATYFGIHVTTFLRNGAAVQLIHVATVFGLLLALGLCVALDRLALALEHRRCTSRG